MGSGSGSIPVKSLEYPEHCAQSAMMSRYASSRDRNEVKNARFSLYHSRQSLGVISMLSIAFHWAPKDVRDSADAQRWLMLQCTPARDQRDQATCWQTAHLHMISRELGKPTFVRLCTAVTSCEHRTPFQCQHRLALLRKE